MPKNPPGQKPSGRQAPRVVRPGAAASSKTVKPPAAPAVYRPQPTPRVLQTKAAVQPPPRASAAPPKPPAPHARQPQNQTPALQPKATSNAGAGLLRAPSSSVIQQRPRDQQAWARQQQRKAWAMDWLREYGKRSKIKDSWFNHVFLGLPFDGSPRDKDDPTGFHAYHGQGTPVPNNIFIIGTIGSTGTFHRVNWRFTDSPIGTSKGSSMFPRTLSQQKVIALILINTKDAWKVEPDDFPPKTPSGKPVTSQMLSDAFGIARPWTLRQTGDTVYPTSP